LDVHPFPTPRPSQAARGPGGEPPDAAHAADGADRADGADTAVGAADEAPPVSSSPETPAVIAAIPARYGSTRLPGKPLLRLAGRPMIEHVYRRVATARGLARIVVLTDDERIADVVTAFGGEVELTPAGCASGTDRIAYAARRWPGAAAVVNVQGDEPLIDPEAVSAIAAHLAAHPEDPMVTLAAPFAARGLAAEIAAELANPNVVKVVVALDGRALYFSRAAIPYARQAAGDESAAAGAAGPGAGAVPLRHLGIYGYQRAALLALAELPPSPLERSEALEQLRALEHGMSIRVLLTAPGLPGVDTREDLERAERLLALGAGHWTAASTTHDGR
jgi:3-deoxy-manno-octulosonate cytidylyltransferase (CMP-KDO synthetase)